jgi:hypothetical protein
MLRQVRESGTRAFIERVYKIEDYKRRLFNAVEKSKRFDDFDNECLVSYKRRPRDNNE